LNFCQEGEREVGVDGAFVELVEQDSIHPLQEGVAL
jgi:hypothetical protein